MSTVEMRANTSFSLAGKSFSGSRAVQGDVEIVGEYTVPVAKAGTLTVRTSVSIGTLTMATGHGFSTADKIDLYWDGGQRRNVVLGTVATNSCPFTGGSGDDLPIATTVISAQKQIVVPVNITGDKLKGIAVSSEQIGTVVFKDASHAELVGYPLSAAAQSKGWTSADGVTNPLAGVTVAEATISQASITKTSVVRYGALVTV